MYDMFDLRVSEYHSDLDRKKDRFWDKHDKVVASFHPPGKPKRPMGTNDEFRRLGSSDRRRGSPPQCRRARRTYESLSNGQPFEQGPKDTIPTFLYGYPHRGKNFGFFALLNLLRPDLFDPSKPPKEQYGRLKEVVIRNNKQEVTDLDGTKLFQEPRTINIEYSYNEEEEYFYGSLESFIREGKAYAQGLSKTEGTAIGLILATMQKLATSSILFHDSFGSFETEETILKNGLVTLRRTNHLIGKLKATRTGDAQVDEESDRKVEEMIDSPYGFFATRSCRSNS